jgi:hypothetical protein
MRMFHAHSEGTWYSGVTLIYCENHHDVLYKHGILWNAVRQHQHGVPMGAFSRVLKSKIHIELSPIVSFVDGHVSKGVDHRSKPREPRNLHASTVLSKCLSIYDTARPYVTQMQQASRR